MVGLPEDGQAAMVGARAVRVNAGLPPQKEKLLAQASSALHAFFTQNVRRAQWLMRVPSSARNCASQAGWAGQAGALTRLPSVWAWSTGMSA